MCKGISQPNRKGAARRSVWLGTILYIPISALLFFLGTALFAYYTALPELLPQTTDVPMKPDKIYPHFIVTELPPGITGLLIASVFAAAMSSVDSSLNCSATLVLCDIYKRYFRPLATERESMFVLYGSTFFWGLLGTIAALAMIHVETILDLWWKLAGIFSGGMLGLFLLGLISTRARSVHAAWAVAAGVVVIVWMSISPLDVWPSAWAEYRSPFDALLTIVFGTATVLIVGIVLSVFSSGGDKSSGNASN